MNVQNTIDELKAEIAELQEKLDYEAWYRMEAEEDYMELKADAEKLADFLEYMTIDRFGYVRNQEAVEILKSFREKFQSDDPNTDSNRVIK